MSNRIRKVFLLLSGLGLFFCCAYISIIQIIVCQTVVLDEFPLPSSINVLVGTSDYTVTDLVTTSQEIVQEQLNFLDEAESEFVSAFYTCENDDCTLFEANIRIHVERRMNCMFSGTSSSPFASTMTNVSFDTINDEIIAITELRQYDRRNALAWQDLPLNIDEIIEIGLEVEANYVREHAEFELSVSLLRDRWTVTFSSDATDETDTRLRIDNDGDILAE